MTNYITVGRRLIPLRHIAFVEPYDPEANPDFQTTREYRGRLVTIDRESVLIEEAPQAFATSHGFRMLNADRVATNPAVHFRVESFLPKEGFVPSKAFATRLLWRNLDGDEQSKLLLSEPETVLAVVVDGTEDEPVGKTGEPQRGKRNGQAPAKEPTLNR